MTVRDDSGSPGLQSRILQIGYMPLIDCAPLVAAVRLGLDRKYGLRLQLQRQASWAAIRDKLLSGELDAVHALMGLVYGVETGIGGPRADLAILLTLNQNGQAITLSPSLAQGLQQGAPLHELLAALPRRPVFTQTFPTGTHAMWLYYWLAAQGIHPLSDVDSVVVPPPQMIAHLQAGRIDGFCVGEPWCASAVKQNLGFTLATTQTIWPDHPEKVLGCTRAFVEQYPNTARALVMAILEASRFIEASRENRRSTAQLLSAPEYLDAPLDCIEPRLLGDYADGLGNHWQDPHAMRFHGNGEVNLPYLSDGMWFMTQFRRWGLLRDDPDYLGVARQVQQLDLYREAATAVGVPARSQEMRSSQLIDGKVWDGSDPAGYARSFTLHAMSDSAPLLASR